MKVDVSNIGGGILKGAVGSALFGLCYSAYYQLDKRVALTFFVLNAISAPVINELSGFNAKINKYLPAITACRSVKDLREVFVSMPRREATSLARNVGACIIAHVVLGTISLIVGRTLGIWGTKMTVLHTFGSACMLFGAGYAHIWAKDQPEGLFFRRPLTELE